MSAEPWADRPPWLVQIRRGPGLRAEGAGVLVTTDHVLTCAHVVTDTAQDEHGNTLHPRPAEPVFVLFQYVDDTRNNRELLADVVEWSGVDDGLDFAVLRLRPDSERPVPSRARPAPLAAPVDVYGHAVGVCGYPSTGDDREHPWHGRITHASDVEFTLEADSELGFELERGFSGGPLWDRGLGGVIGIVAQRMKARRPDAGVDPASIRVGTAVRIDAIAERWEGLPRLLGVTPPRLATLVERLRGGDRLPLVGEAELNEFGIYPDTPVYATRSEVDAKLDTALRESPFVVVTGESKAGKSRSLAEAVRRFAADRSLIVPKEIAAVATLASGPLPTAPAGAVVWLEDLDRYLVPGGLDERVLRRFARHDPPITVVATMDGGTYQRYRSGTPQLDKRTGELVRRAGQVGVRDRLDPADLVGAKAAYPKFDAADGRLGYQLFSGPDFEWMFRNGRDSSPVGWAVLMAAIDWRRTGADTPVPEADLRTLLIHYLDDDEPDDETFAAALRWAADATPAIRRIGDRGYLPEGYLVAMVAGEDVPISLDVWWHVAGSPVVTATDLLVVTHHAARLGLPHDLAMTAADTARHRADTPLVEGWAALMCGQLEFGRGELDAARERLGEAIASGQPEVVPFAQVELAGVAMREDSLDEAEELLDAAMSSDSPEARRLAKANLATIRWSQAELGTAEVMLEEVVASAQDAEPLAQAQLGAMLASQGLGHRQEPASPQRRTGPVRLIQSVQEFSGMRATNLAQTNLGILKIDQGQAERARALLEASLAANDLVIRPIAAAGMGRLLLVEGDLEGAGRYFDEAIASGEPNASGLAGVGKAMLAHGQGDIDTALEELAGVADGGHPHYGPLAAYMLGDLLRLIDDEHAAEAFQAAIDSGHRDWSQAAKIGLAILLWTGREDEARARALLDEVIGTGHRDNGPWAATVLGELLAEDDDAEGARAAYQQAIDSQHTDWAVVAAIDLALLMWNQEDRDVDDVVPILRTAADSGHQHQAPRASELLGDVFNAVGDVEGARAAYTRTVESGHAFWSGAARIDLAVLEVDEEGDFDRALELLNGACESEFDIVASAAHLLRGMIHQDRDDRAQAHADLEIAAERAADADVATQSTYWLTVLDLAAGERAEACAHAEVLTRHLEEWSGIAPPLPDHPAEGMRPVLRVIDHLYVLGLTERSELLTELETLSDDLDPADRAGVRARTGRRLFQEERYAEAEPVLRALLSDSELGWEDEAIARRYLAALQVLTKPEPDVTSLDAAREVLAPFLDRPDPANGASALQLLGQIAVLRGRRDHAANRAADALRHFEEGAELLRRAESQARAQGDTDTADEALRDLEKLPEARGEAQLELPPARPIAIGPAPDIGKPVGEKPSAEIWRLLGEVASAEGTRREAEHWLRKADRQDPRTELAFAVLELEAGEWLAARTRTRALLGRQLSAEDREFADQVIADIELLRPLPTEDSLRDRDDLR